MIEATSTVQDAREDPASSTGLSLFDTAINIEDTEKIGRTTYGYNVQMQGPTPGTTAPDFNLKVALDVSTVDPRAALTGVFPFDHWSDAEQNTRDHCKKIRHLLDRHWPSSKILEAETDFPITTELVHAALQTWGFNVSLGSVKKPKIPLLGTPGEFYYVDWQAVRSVCRDANCDRGLAPLDRAAEALGPNADVKVAYHGTSMDAASFIAGDQGLRSSEVSITQNQKGKYCEGPDRKQSCAQYSAMNFAKRSRDPHLYGAILELGVDNTKGRWKNVSNDVNDLAR